MKKNAGQALVEAVVVVGIVVVISVGLLAGATASLQANRFGKAKTLSVRYAQEAMEVVRSMRNTNWASFALFATNGVTPTTWCMDSAGQLQSYVAATGCTTFPVGTMYTRQVTFTWNDPNMLVDVLVAWSDGSKNYSTSISTVFTQWR